MRTIRPRNSDKNQGQNAGVKGDSLFEPDEFGWWLTEFHPSALELLDLGIEGVMRRTVLQILPAEQLGKQFSPDQGRPTKDLHAICGLLFLAEFKNWTIDEAAAAWTFDASVHYALGLGHRKQFISPRTIDNYRKKVKAEGFASLIFEEVTATLTKELGLEVTKQRLDSTHVLSNMAKFGRLKLLSTTTKRFLVNIARHNPDQYDPLPGALKERYTVQESRLFGQGSKNPEPQEQALEQVGEDMWELITCYAADSEISNRNPYKALDRAFHDHFIFDEETAIISLRPKAQGQENNSRSVMQNSSDMEAGYSGHKGSGYQAQINQAYDTGDGPGLVTGCLVQAAGESDSASLSSIHEQQQRLGTKPATQLADSAYGSQHNVDTCAAGDIILISPTLGKSPQATTPPTQAKTEAAKPTPPKTPSANPDKSLTTKNPTSCAEAAAQPPEANPEQTEPPLTDKEKLSHRREAEGTKEWKNTYNKRCGVEGVHAAINRMTGFKKLRVRGMKAVSLAVYCKVAGYNMHLAARILKKRTINAQKAAIRHILIFWSLIRDKKTLWLCGSLSNKLGNRCLLS